MPKSRYFTDTENRLIRVRKDKNNRREMSAVKGEFTVEGHNQLVYKVEEDKRWKREVNLPDKIRFRGNWRLDDNHDLEIILNETAEQYAKDVLTLKGEIVGVESDELTFAITSRKDRDAETTRIIKLAGKWQADEFNRLGFLVSKEDGDDDILVFDGIWEVGKNQDIIYRYKKIRLKRKIKESRDIIFRGSWRITEKDKLAYLLDTSGESGFLFKAQLEGPNVVGKRGELKYRIGIGLTQYKRPVERVIKFFGALEFNLTRADEIEFELTDSVGKKLGVSVTLSRRLLGGKAFLRLKRQAQESRVEAGVKIPW